MKRLKKILMVSLSAIACMVVVGCSPKEEVKSIDVAKVRTDLSASNLLKQDYQDTGAKEHYMFEGNFDKIKDGFVSQAMINVKLQDVIVVEGNTSEDADALMESIEAYKENNLRMFADGYGGEENSTAVANSKLAKVGNVVYFIASEGVEDIEKLILGE